VSKLLKSDNYSSTCSQ